MRRNSYGAIAPLPEIVQHPALDFFLELQQDKDWWQHCFGAIKMPNNVQPHLAGLKQTTSLQELNSLALTILHENEFSIYLNAKVKRNAAKSLISYFILSAFGSLTIAEFTLYSANLANENLMIIFGIMLPAWVMLTLAIISIVVNGPVYAAVFKECYEQIADVLSRIVQIFLSMTSVCNKFAAIGYWILLEIFVYTCGFLSAAGDYQQALGINWISFLATAFVSFINGAMSFYGFKEPYIDLRDYLHAGNTVSSLATEKNLRALMVVMLLSSVAYAGISPPAFLAAEYENGSVPLMIITQLATVGASSLFSYKAIVKNSITWPNNVDKQRFVSSYGCLCSLSGINMLAALTMLLVKIPTFPVLLAMIAAVVVFISTGVYNGLASVPVSTDIYEKINVASSGSSTIGYRELKKLFSHGNHAVLQESCNKLNALISSDAEHQLQSQHQPYSPDHRSYQALPS